MSAPTEPKGDRFECSGLSVYFIYSFLLSKVADSQHEIVTPDMLFKEEAPNEGWGTPKNRQGLKQILELLHEQIGWRAHNPIRAEVVNAKLTSPVRVEIQPLVRLFPAGATCSFRVRLQNPESRIVPLKAIHAILQLVQQTETEPTPSRLRIEGTATSQPLKTLYQLFSDYVNGYVTAPDAKASQIDWLCKVLVPKVSKLDPGDEPQTPWVVTVAEVKDRTKTHAVFCGTFEEHRDPAAEKAFLVKSYEPEVAGILYRSVKGEDFQLEPGYVDFRLPGAQPGLHSFNLDARLYVALSNRSILCICREEDKEDKEGKGDLEVADYFIPDLLDLCEMLRARWHMLVIMNIGLNKVLEILFDKNRTAEDRMKVVVNARRWLAQCMDDSEVYRVSGDALANIALRLKEIFREGALRQLLLQKADLVERVRAGVSELAWLSMETQQAVRPRE